MRIKTPFLLIALVALAAPLAAAGAPSAAVPLPMFDAGCALETVVAGEELLFSIAPEVGSDDLLEPFDQQPEDVDICDYEYRWVGSGCCMHSRREKQQRRWCCQQTGCGGWQDTGATQCTNWPC